MSDERRAAGAHMAPEPAARSEQAEQTADLSEAAAILAGEPSPDAGQPADPAHFAPEATVPADTANPTPAAGAPLPAAPEPIASQVAASDASAANQAKIPASLATELATHNAQRPAVRVDDPDAPGSTGPLPVEAIAEQLSRTDSTLPGTDAVHPPTIDLSARHDAGVETGGNTRLSWGARTDVGFTRSHNEDSFLIRAPLFCVCDGMGGHAAGEVASSIAVQAIAEHAPDRADDALLGAAVEAANEAVIEGAATGKGKPGMGCTASCCVVADARMAVAHVGDSRIYLLHGGTLVRITHDHSYVEELVDAGEITADEARVHPSRSIITRALGSDPDMYADHFSLDVERGDRLVLCSDGLSSMVADPVIESICVSSATPQDCADNLVAAALSEGGHDNVTVIVVDVMSDGREEQRRRARRRSVLGWVAAVAIVAVAVMGGLALFVGNSWYVSTIGDSVGIFRGVHATVFGMPLSRLEQTTPINAGDLPEATRRQLDQGIIVSSLDEARSTVSSYQSQIEEERQKAEQAAQGAQAESTDGSVGDATGAAGPQATTTAPATQGGA